MRFLREAPERMFAGETGEPPDRALDSARRIAAAAVNENAEAHAVLDRYDPDPEPGETLAERLARVLAPRLVVMEE